MFQKQEGFGGSYKSFVEAGKVVSIRDVFQQPLLNDVRSTKMYVISIILRTKLMYETHLELS